MSGDRRIRYDYFEVAKQILQEDGHGGLSIAEMCGRLGVSKGSFYHHFDSMQQFVEELLREWERSFEAWWAAADAVGDPVDRINMMFDMVADEMTNRFDAAMRKWGHTDPAVARAVARHDDSVRYATEHTLALIVSDPARRRLLAQLGLNLWAGFQVRDCLEREDLLPLSVEVVRSCWGLECGLVEENGRLVARVVPESLRKAVVT